MRSLLSHLILSYYKSKWSERSGQDPDSRLLSAAVHTNLFSFSSIILFSLQFRSERAPSSRASSTESRQQGQLSNFDKTKRQKLRTKRLCHVSPLRQIQPPKSASWLVQKAPPSYPNPRDCPWDPPTCTFIPIASTRDRESGFLLSS